MPLGRRCSFFWRRQTRLASPLGRRTMWLLRGKQAATTAAAFAPTPTAWLHSSSSPAAAPVAVDIARYPLHDPARCRALVDQHRAELLQQGYCHLPGFLRAEAVAYFIQEAQRLEAAGLGFRSYEAHNVFLEEAAATSATEDGALRTKEFASSKVLIAMDDIAPGASSGLEDLYRWEALRSFLRAAFGLGQLHRSADPLGGFYYNIYDGAFNDTLGWHFDRSNFSMNLILQTTPGAGGEFQYVPDSRPAIDGMGTWAEVEAHIKGRVQTPELLPGSLYLFSGNRSLHRVAPVVNGKRINIIFTFVEEEGARLNPYTLRKFFGRTEVRGQ